MVNKLEITYRYHERKLNNPKKLEDCHALPTITFARRSQSNLIKNTTNVLFYEVFVVTI
jgi:hypothetical protein